MAGTTAADTINYKISYVNGTLTIDQPKQQLRFPTRFIGRMGRKNLAAVVTGQLMVRP